MEISGKKSFAFYCKVVETARKKYIHRNTVEK